MTKMLTTFLFARPRFSFGVARLLDLGATFDCYNISRSQAEADVKAMLADWYIVSADLQAAMREAESEDCWSSNAQEKATSTTETISSI